MEKQNGSYIYLASELDLTPVFVAQMKKVSTQVSVMHFIQAIDTQVYEEIDRCWYGYDFSPISLEMDTGCSFYSSTYRGNSCYYLVRNGICYVFVKKDYPFVSRYVGRFHTIQNR